MDYSQSSEFSYQVPYHYDLLLSILLMEKLSHGEITWLLMRLKMSTGLAWNQIYSLAALFTTVKMWKQPKCPSTDEWIKKMWCIYTQRNITQP